MTLIKATAITLAGVLLILGFTSCAGTTIKKNKDRKATDTVIQFRRQQNPL